MIASDVDGKNHHRDGSFGQHLESLSLILPSGERVCCSPDDNPALFAAAIGGMGLTGIIVEVTFSLRRLDNGWIRQTVTVAHDLDRTLDILDATRGATYSVAWIDGTARGASLGRSLVFSEEHRQPRRRRLPALGDACFHRSATAGLTCRSTFRNGRSTV